jgi:hypothetical protein
VKTVGIGCACDADASGCFRLSRACDRRIGILLFSWALLSVAVTHGNIFKIEPQRRSTPGEQEPDGSLLGLDVGASEDDVLKYHRFPVLDRRLAQFVSPRKLTEPRR